MKQVGLLARRRFFASAGALLAAPAAALAVARAHASAAGRGPLAVRLAALEDLHAIRELERAYVRHSNAGKHSSVAALFADPDRARFDTGRRAISADADGELEIAPDRRTAVTRLPCVVSVDVPIEAPGCTLLDMAKAHGEGVLRRTERRQLTLTFVRDARGWKIERALV